VISSGDRDWRLTVRFESERHADSAFSALKTHAAAALVVDKLTDAVVTEREGEWVRVYAGSYDALRREQTIVASTLEAERARAE
jgi:hypothetical protein